MSGGLPAGSRDLDAARAHVGDALGELVPHALAATDFGAPLGSGLPDELRWAAELPLPYSRGMEIMRLIAAAAARAIRSSVAAA